MADSPFREYPASDAREFLDLLRITNPLWVYDEREWRHHWLFRGQGSASKELIPSVWRTDPESTITKLLDLFIKKDGREDDKGFVQKWLSLGAEFRGVHIDEQTVENAVQLYYRTKLEIHLISDLLDQALLRGTNVPDYQRIREFLNLYIGNPFRVVQQLASSNPDALDQEFETVIHHNSFFALAQHHGIPTRLLDWTTNPYIAAFFAAEGALSALERGNAEQYLAVFASHEHVLSPNGIMNFPFPKSDNPFLLAQRGELTVYKGSSDFLFSGKFPTIEDILRNASIGEEQEPKKITLSIEKAPELLRLLAVSEGIARDQLMPTFDNIAYVVKQRFMLDLSS